MDLISVLLALPILLFILYQKFKNSPHYPPGPKCLPIIGNLHQIQFKNPQRFLFKLAQRFGPIFTLKMGTKKFVIISSADLAKDVLKTQDLNFCTRPYFSGQQMLSYNGLDIAFGQYTPYWREIRKFCMINLFNPTRVQTFRPERAEEVTRMVEKLYTAAETSQVVDVSELMLSFTNSVVCRVAFGKRYADYGSEMRNFIEILYETQTFMNYFFYKDYFPFCGWVDSLRGGKSRLEKITKRSHDFMQAILDDHLDPNRPPRERDTLVDSLIQMCNTNSFEFTHDNIKAITLDIIVAGTDTAAAVVVWAMTYLLKYPKTMKKVQEEVRSLIGDRGYLTEDDMINLPYLKAVIKETLRLEPVIPILLHREAIEDCKVGGYDIPAKTIVQVNAWAVSRDTKAWGENPEEFRPERFLEKNVDYRGLDFELLPFGSGRRMCPGMNMGVAMMELPLATYLYKFDWKLPPGVKAEDINMDVMTGLAMHKAEHIMLIPIKHI